MRLKELVNIIKSENEGSYEFLLDYLSEVDYLSVYDSGVLLDIVSKFDDDFMRKTFADIILYKTLITQKRFGKILERWFGC